LEVSAVERVWGIKLPLLFLVYPDGRPGLVLLVFRASLGLALMIQAWLCLAESGSAPRPLVGVMTLLIGLLLIAGLLAHIAAAFYSVVTAATALLHLPGCISVFDTTSSLIFGAAILFAVLLIGPGAYSVDACLFGRREIIIPPSSKHLNIKRESNDPSK